MTGPTHHDIPLDLGNVDHRPPAADPAPTSRQAARRREGRATRWALVQRVRREIARGTYETPEKWEAVVMRLLALRVI